MIVINDNSYLGNIERITKQSIKDFINFYLKSKKVEERFITLYCNTYEYEDVLSIFLKEFLPGQHYCLLEDIGNVSIIEDVSHRNTLKYMEEKANIKTTWIFTDNHKKGTHEEALLELMNTAVNTGILPVDMSKQNTCSSENVNRALIMIEVFLNQIEEFKKNNSPQEEIEKRRDAAVGWIDFFITQ